MTDGLRSPSPFDPAAFLLLAHALGSNGAHEAELKAAQQDLVQSDTLPKRGIEGFLQFGVEVIGPVPGDNYVMFVKLPPGWKKRATAHEMWSELLDEQGRVRGAMFRGPFYDRGDYITVTPKYGVETDVEHRNATGEVIARVRCAGEVVFSTPPRKGLAGDLGSLEDAGRRKNFELGDEAEAEAIAWLNENFPKWQERHAYW